ncbi:MAG: hypothetical protein IT457_19115 [Planctomycetes bacterium]|nr:hypothetical protein [Planctomycetota bacterium]
MAQPTDAGAEFEAITQEWTSGRGRVAADHRQSIAPGNVALEAFFRAVFDLSINGASARLLVRSAEARSRWVARLWSSPTLRTLWGTRDRAEQLVLAIAKGTVRSTCEP